MGWNTLVRPSTRTRAQVSPSPIGWERAGVRDSVICYWLLLYREADPHLTLPSPLPPRERRGYPFCRLCPILSRNNSVQPRMDPARRSRNRMTEDDRQTNEGRRIRNGGLRRSAELHSAVSRICNPRGVASSKRF